MIDYFSTFTNTDGAAFPNTFAVNATGPSTTDGTEFTKPMIDDMWGARQALMDYAGLTPDTVTEAPGTAQTLTAYKKGFNIGPGFVVSHYLTSTALTGHRILPLNGQGVLVASYPDLAAATYVGDANNAAVAAGGGKFYKADDAAGTIPNTAGIYLILPETRGYVPRGLDLAATVDPLGAGRYLGDNQMDAFQGHGHAFQRESDGSNLNSSDSNPPTGGSATTNAFNNTASSIWLAKAPQDLSGYGTAKISTETRMANTSINFGITY